MICTLRGALLALLAGCSVQAADLQFAGVLGNSGDTGGSLVTFAGQKAGGIGLVLDDQNTLWERGGSKQLNRYALDGRLLASFELPDSPERNDQMTRVDDLLVIKLRKALYTLPLKAAKGTQPKRLAGEADVISSNSVKGQLIIADKGTLYWLDVALGTRLPLLKPELNVQALHLGADSTVYAFGEGKVMAWKNAAALDGFPKGFTGERPQKIGKYWYSQSWHGTINRMNEAFEPDPGVVLGGASGSFIGYMPASNDINNGRSMVQLKGDLYAISGVGGIIQFLKWNEAEARFDVVRRIGALAELQGLALDAAGHVWTPHGSWRWTDTSTAPRTLGDIEPMLCAQPVVLDGKTLCMVKKHYQYVQLVHGPLIDASELSHFETQGIKDFALPETITGAAAFSDGKGLRMIVVERGGKAFELGITMGGQIASNPQAATIPGLKNCTSLAWFSDRLIAADSGAVIAFERSGDRAWKESARIADFGGDVYVHSDGKRLAVSDPAHGAVHLYESMSTKLASYNALTSPAQVAVSDDRVVVYESGQQRLVKLELNNSTKVTAGLQAQPAPATKVKTAAHDEADFQDMGHPGGVPFAIALTIDKAGLTVSVRTQAEPAPRIELGVANETSAYTLSHQQARQSKGQFDFQLPAGDWSKLRLAAAIQMPDQQERFGFLDHKAIHAPFNRDPATWAPFDLEIHRELVSARRQEIRLTFDQPVEGKATIVIDNKNGGRVRNLVSGRSFAAGSHTVVWDGLDEQGKLVAPGTYQWRGITHPGVKPVYKMNFGNGDEKTIEAWGPNHSTLQHAVSNRDLVFFAAPVTEGGWALLALDANGKFVQGYEHQQGIGGIQRDAIAVDGQYLYCAQDGFPWGGTRDVNTSNPKWTATWKLTIVRFDIKTGKLVEFPGKRRALEVDKLEVGPGSSHPDLEDFNLGGLALLDGRLYVGARSKKAVLVIDAASGNQVESLPLDGLRHLAAGKDVLAATDKGVVRVRNQKLIVPAGDMNLTGITVAPNGDILVSDQGSHQVRRFTAEGKPVGVIGKPCGPYKGAYDAARMVNPAGLVFGPDGKLWVTEDRWNPKRVVAWDLAKSEVAYEKFGMPHYGGDGSGFDPENPRRWIGLGCFWDVDVDSGAARPTHILSLEEGHLGKYEPHSYTFFREGGRTYLYTRGKITMISEVLPDGTLHDLVATAGTHHFAYAFNWQPPQAYIDAFYAKWPAKRALEKPGRKNEGKPWSARGMGVLWVDRNGDGETQKEEFDFCGDDIDYAGASWGHQQSSLTLYMPVADKTQVKIAALKPKSMLANGVPDYPTLDEAIARATPIDLTPGYKRSGVATVRDSQGRFIFNSDPEMNGYAADGKHLWSYPNQWSDVHGSHDAPLPEPGVMQGNLAILGKASFDKEADVFFLNGNHGRCFLLTTDGLYLDEAFVDVRVSYLKNEYRLGGEIFGGSFGRAEPTGKYYVQIGHGPYRIYELTGLQQAKRQSGTLTVSANQIAAAEKQSLRHAAAKQVNKEATLPGTIRWDKSGKFRTELQLSSDATHLNLRYRVEDTSPWVNNGREWFRLFATGDTVDLQIGSDTHADPKRKEPVAGDKRLLIAPFEGKPVAVLYEHRKPGGKNPIEFTSPWRGARVDNVQQLPDAKITVKKETGSYTVEAAIPLTDLGLALKPGETFRADFGVTFGDAAGTDTNLRSYWSNQSTGLVDDIPGEIMLSPHLWGELKVGK